MHDPLTQAFDIRWPIHITIWHRDPEKGPGGDDSCGWFKRAHHGDPRVLDRIVKRFEEDWDRTWTYDPEKDGCGEGDEKGKTIYPCGYFNPNGMPRFSVTGIVLNLFFMGACEHFNVDGRSNWKKARRWMSKHLFDIMLFAENPSDSLFDGLTLKFGNDTRREDRIQQMACTIYGWILRAEQRWWQHPRWHIHHWRIQVHCLQLLWRCLFRRCAKCGKRFRYSESVCGSWSGDAIWHFRCDQLDKPTNEIRPLH